MFLLNAPDASNRVEVKQLIARLESELAEERATKAAPPPNIEAPSNPDLTRPVPQAPATPSTTPPAGNGATLTAAPPPPRKQPTYKKWWVWTLVGVAVAGGAAAGIAVAATRPGSAPTAPTSFGNTSPF
jgi:hypothetical protein